MGALAENPTHSSLPVLVARAVELETGYRMGILPRAGGWDDQDPEDIKLIRLASNIRSSRERVERRKQEAKRKLFRRKK
jgi:hypothetical protein